jgi:hypothetical protein
MLCSLSHCYVDLAHGQASITFPGDSQVALRRCAAAVAEQIQTDGGESGENRHGRRRGVFPPLQTTRCQEGFFTLLQSHILRNNIVIYTLHSLIT